MADNFYASYPVSGGGSDPNPNIVLKYSKTYADFSTAGMSKDVSLPNVPAGFLIEFTVLNVTQLFSGGGVGSASILTTVTGDSTASPVNGTGLQSNSQVGTAAFASTILSTNVVNLTCDVNLNTLTAGAFDIYYIGVQVF